MALLTKEQSVYRTILTSAWSVVWKNKWLWPFGVVAAIAGTGGAASAIIKAAWAIGSGAPLTGGATSTIDIGLVLLLRGTLAQQWFTVLATIGIAAFGALCIYLATATTGTLLFATRKLAIGKSTKLTESWSAGTAKFWPLFCITFASRFLLSLFLLATVTLFYTTNLWNWCTHLLIIGSFVLFSLVAVITSFIASLASVAVVTRKHSISEAIREAFEILWEHPLVSIELMFILLGVSVAAASLMLVLLTFLALPFLLLITASFLIGSASAAVVIAIIGLLLGVLLIITAGGILGAFENTVWVLLYEKFAKGAVIAKLERLASRIWNRIR